MDKPESLRQDYDDEDFKRLIQFYLACLEEEDLKSLTFRLSQLRRSFLSPWSDYESLFSRNSPEVEIEWDFADREFLLRGTDQTGDSQRLFYGYPIYVDSEDMISPLFFIEVTLNRNEDIAGEKFLIRPVDPEEIQFNHHHLNRQHYSIDEIQEIQEYLEGDFGSFRSRLSAAFERLGLEEPDKVTNLDPLPTAESAREVWCYRPILFRSERSSYTAQLRRELDALRKYPRFIDEAFNTSLGYLFAPSKASSDQDTVRTDARFIEVRPLNACQERAMLSGLTAPLTVVTGPPGTGKSQVVVNLLANAALSGQTVLFASKNNKAVDVVRSWLEDVLGIDRNWTFRVGSRQRMAEMREEMIGRLSRLEADAEDLTINESQETIDRLTDGIQVLQNKMDDLRKQVTSYHNALQKCRMAQARIPEEWVLDETEALEISFDGKALDRLGRETRALASGESLGFLLWFQRVFLGRRLREKYLRGLESLTNDLPDTIRMSIEEKVAGSDLDWATLADCCERLVLFARWLAALHKANSLQNRLASGEQADEIKKRMDRAKEERSIASRALLRSVWTRRIEPFRQQVEHLVRRYFDLSERMQQPANRETWLRLRDDFETTCTQLMHYFPSWIVTNLSARRALPLSSNMFDLLIVDEASQCDIASAIPLMFRAKRAIVIGDPHQLRHISTLPAGKEMELAESCEAAPLLTDWSYTGQSLYDVSAGASLCMGKTPIMLIEHYRSHYGIIEFSNRTFYQRSLVLRTDIPALAERLGRLELGVFWHDIRGRVPHTVRSAYNDAEIDAIMEMITSWHGAGLLDKSGLSLGIVAPFRAQVDHIETRLRDQPWYAALKDRITVGTAHTFQGDEADVVLFSPVVAEGLHPRKAKWVASTDQLLNVAITRARGALHIFGDMNACLDAGSYLGQLAAYARDGAAQGKVWRYDSKAEEEMAKLLDTTGLWYQPQYEEGRYRLDFFVVSPFGIRYDLEIDGRQHWRAEELERDAVRDATLEGLGYRVVRVSAEMVFNRAEAVLGLLRRLA